MSPAARPGAGAPVLVAIDEGEDRHVALEFAATQARSIGRALRVVHVVHPLNRVVPRQRAAAPPSEQRPGTSDPVGTSARTLLAEAAEVVRAQFGDTVPVTTDVLEGMPIEVILQAAESADQVYLQRRHLSVLDNVLNGPVVAGVAARSPVPVVIVPEAFSGWDLPGRRRVSVAFKRYGHEQELLELAFRTATRMQAGLRVVRALEPHRLHGFMHGIGLPGGHHAGHEAPPVEGMTAAELRLLEDLAPWRARFPEVPTRAQVVRERPAIALLEATAESDLLLISRPPSRLRANALGTLSRGLIREAVCPVAVVPAHGHVPAHARAEPHARSGPEAASSRGAGADAWGPLY